jgi:putative glutamine amidotransferase
MKVNSAHHQAVKNVPDSVTVSARSPDGVIEAIEVADKTFCLGVQWHPEYRVDPGDVHIMQSFRDAARTRSQTRNAGTIGK